MAFTGVIKAHEPLAQPNSYFQISLFNKNNCTKCLCSYVAVESILRQTIHQ